MTVRQSSACFSSHSRRVARHPVDLLADLVDVGQVLRVGVLAARRLRLAVRLDLAVVDRRSRAGAATRSSCRRRRAGPPRPPSARRPAARCRARAAAPRSPVRRPTARRPAASAGSARRAPARSPSGRPASSTPTRSSRGTCSARRRRTRSGRVASWIAAFIRSATVLPSGSPHAFSVTSRYASSSDSGSTSGVTERKISNTVSDAALYLRKSGRTMMQVRAETHRARHRDGGAHAEHARLVARGGDHAALVARRRRPRPACRAARDCRAARPTRRTRPCRCGGSGGAAALGHSVRRSRQP